MCEVPGQRGMQQRQRETALGTEGKRALTPPTLKPIEPDKLKFPSLVLKTIGTKQ